VKIEENLWVTSFFYNLASLWLVAAGYLFDLISPMTSPPQSLRDEGWKLGRCNVIAPYVSLALPQVKSLIPKAVHKYIRIYLYSTCPTVKIASPPENEFRQMAYARKTKNSSKSSRRKSRTKSPKSGVRNSKLSRHFPSNVPEILLVN